MCSVCIQKYSWISTTVIKYARVNVLFQDCVRLVCQEASIATFLRARTYVQQCFLFYHPYIVSAWVVVVILRRVTHTRKGHSLTSAPICAVYYLRFFFCRCSAPFPTNLSPIFRLYRSAMQISNGRKGNKVMKPELAADITAAFSSRKVSL